MRRTVESALPSSAKTVVVSLRSSRGIPCSMAHLSSMKLPSAPESMSARPLTVMPAHQRTAEIVVQDLGREEMTVALTSTPPSTGELWPFNGHEAAKCPFASQYRQRRLRICRSRSSAEMRTPPSCMGSGSEQRGEDTMAGVKASSGLETAP